MKKITLFIGLCASVFAFAAETSKANREGTDFNPKVLDGVVIEAVENYPNPKNHEIGFGLGLYPLKPYYNGFSLNADYVHYFNRTFAWEIANAAVAFTVQTGLSSQLAEDYGVNPESIERLRAVFSTNAMYVHSHGKLLFLNRFIRYFRSHAIGGLGLVTTSNRSRVALSLGVRLDAYVTDSFSWKLEIRDMITFSGFEHFAVVSIGTGINF